MPHLIEESFSAWIDKMPGGEHKLIVKGEAEVPTGGWHSSLKPADPTGINPDVLILDVELTAPSGPATEAITTIECRYEESPPRRNYTNVTLRYDRQEFTIDVTETH